MSKDPRILNLTRGTRLRFSQASKGVENGIHAWVDVGISVRDLTLAEVIAVRTEIAKNREPLPYAEEPGLRFDPPTGMDAAYRQGRLLAYEASLFVDSMKGVPALVSA